MALLRLTTNLGACDDIRLTVHRDEKARRRGRSARGVTAWDMHLGGGVTSSRRA